MQYLKRNAKLVQRVVLCTMLLLLALFAGACSGGSAGLNAAPAGPAAHGGQPSSDLAGGSTAPPAGLPELPSPATIGRSASLIETGASVKGSSFRADLVHQHVTVNGDLADFNPAFLSGDHPLYSDLALAIYSLDVSPDSGDFSGDFSISLDGTSELANGTVHIMCGFPSLAGDTWQWMEMAPASELAAKGVSWSWGVSQQGTVSSGLGGGAGMGRRAPNGLLNVVVVVTGDTALHVSNVSVKPPNHNPPAMSLAFRKGWDGTIKGRTQFDGDCAVVGDGQGRLYFSYYDSSSGQLYCLRLQDRLLTTKAVECDGDMGLFNDIALAPDGGLFLPYYDANLKNMRDRLLDLESLTDMTWSASDVVDTGDGGGGLPPADVGQHCSVVFDPVASRVHVFYEDATDHRIKHASRPWSNGLPPAEPWVTEYVSPPGQQAYSPKAMLCADGACCIYIVDTDSDPSTDNTLVFARAPGVPATWETFDIATDVLCPFPGTESVGFCDGSVRENTLVAAYSCSSGGGCGKVNVHDMSYTTPVKKREAVYNPAPGSGAFVQLQQAGDGSVRIADYSRATLTVYFSSGIPTTGQFSCVPAVQLAGGDVDEDCDGLAFWVNPAADADALFEAALVVSSSSISIDGTSKKHTKTGHVTLLK